LIGDFFGFFGALKRTFLGSSPKKSVSRARPFDAPEA